MKPTVMALVVLVPGLSSCGTGIYVPDADAYVTNPFKYTTARSLITVQTTWDRALAPVPCSSLRYIGKTWFITGKIEANGLVFKDQPLTDPAVAPAIRYKRANHIGPGC